MARLFPKYDEDDIQPVPYIIGFHIRVIDSIFASRTREIRSLVLEAGRYGQNKKLSCNAQSSNT